MATIQRLPSASASFESASRTVSLSFAADPLLDFLYDRNQKYNWGDLLDETQAWQAHRLRHYALQGEIFEAKLNDENVGLYVLNPPKRPWLQMNPTWWWQWMKTILLRWYRPAQETCCDQERVGQLFSVAEEQAAIIRRKFGSDKVWYLAMIVVSPEVQGQGVGGQLIRHIIDKIGNAPCFLECTNPSNVAFYEKFGFILFEERKLEDRHDAAHSTTLYYMVRAGR